MYMKLKTLDSYGGIGAEAICEKEINPRDKSKVISKAGKLHLEFWETGKNKNKRRVLC